MVCADINPENLLVQHTLANHLRDNLGWESVYAFNGETLGLNGTLGQADRRGVVLTSALRGQCDRPGGRRRRRDLMMAPGRVCLRG